MRRAFRLGPPALAQHALTRPRLIRALRARWESPVTLLVAGPGMGKTTLLAQARAENLLAPRGRDVWFGVDARDVDADHLAQDLVAAVGGRADLDPAEAVWGAVWSRAPTPTCLLLDDFHHLVAGSSGLELVERVIEGLPDNGHVLVASRTPPPLRLARLAATGAVVELDEADLLLTEDELAEFAERRDADVAHLHDTGGWPALAELATHASRGRAGAFVWEEVLEPLGERRGVLATLCDLGGADDALMSAALDAPVDLASALAGVPLIATDVAGWHEPHQLWRTVESLQLPPDERSAVRRRAVRHLLDIHRHEDAFELLAGDGMWDLAPDALRDACLVGTRPLASQLDGWLERCPDDVLARPAGRLAVGVRATMRDPTGAVAPLEEAMAGFQRIGDEAGEVAAITHIGRLAWWRQDLSALAVLIPRVAELAANRHRAAMALDRIGRAIVCDLQADDQGIWDALADVEQGSGDEWWDVVIVWLRSVSLAGRGDDAAALALIDGVGHVGDATLAGVLASSRVIHQWSLGQVDAVLASAPSLLALHESTGVAQNTAISASLIAYAMAHLGSTDAARPYLDRAMELLPATRAVGTVRVHIADAAVRLADGDEGGAADVLRVALREHPIGQGTPRRAWREMLALTYVLVPEVRKEWDAAPLSGSHAAARQLAAAVAAGRGAEIEDPIDLVDVSCLDRVRGALHHRLAAELAVRLHGAGRREGAALLDLLGEPGRAVVRQLARGGPPATASAAHRLLTAVPAAPSFELTICAFGPLEVRRDGEVVEAPELKRMRVRSLLAFLLLHRVTTREAVTASMWPDLDSRAAANNLRGTLSHLLHALEPGRPENEPAYFVRADGPRLRLVIDSAAVDLDRFDDHLRDAQQADENDTLSVALAHYEAAAGLYQGDLFADLGYDEWFEAERERYRLRFVDAAVRAAHLLVAVGRLGEAERLADRALVGDPWCEAACGALVSVALARDDRSAARHHLQRCLGIVAELGAEPAEETRRLQREVRGATTRIAPAPRG